MLADLNEYRYTGECFEGRADNMAIDEILIGFLVIFIIDVIKKLFKDVMSISIADDNTKTETEQINNYFFIIL